MSVDKKDWRLSIALTPKQEEAIVELRKTDEYARCSFGEIVRQLIDAGLGVTKHDDSRCKEA